MHAEDTSPERRISRGAVAIYKEYTGRGPTGTRTEITASAAMTICTDSLTKAERRLVEDGDGELVRAMRRKFQDVMKADYVAMVEEATDREAANFLSDHDAENDVAMEVVTFIEGT